MANPNCKTCGGTGSFKFEEHSKFSMDIACTCEPVADSYAYPTPQQKAAMDFDCSSDDDPYVPSEPTPAQEAVMERIERALAESATRDARAAIATVARALLAEFVGVRSVRVGCELYEVDGDHGVEPRLDFSVDVAFGGGAEFDARGLGELTEALAAVEDAAAEYGPLAVPVDRFFIVTRDGTEVV